MTFIDVAIPAIVGLVALVWPNLAFLGSSATPDPRKIRFVRICGAGLLVVAAIYLAMRLAGT